MFNPKTGCSVLMALVMFAGAGIAQNKSAAKPRTKHTSRTKEDFAATMQKLRGIWVEEFNAGHADKVAALYAPEAVLMRWDGSVHGYDSILAELQKSVSAGAHDYVVHSLHAERSGGPRVRYGCLQRGTSRPRRRGQLFDCRQAN